MMLSLPLSLLPVVQSSLPTQGLSSNHLLSLDSLLAIVKSFQSWQQQALPAPPENAAPVNSTIPDTEGENTPRNGTLSVCEEGSTQVNSAGIIFSSRPEREELVEEMSITSVRSDSALAEHATGTAVEIAQRSTSCGTGSRDIVKAASGYMMATRGAQDGDGVAEVTVVELPTPKEFIEIRQRKKVGFFVLALLRVMK